MHKPYLHVNPSEIAPLTNLKPHIQIQNREIMNEQDTFGLRSASVVITAENHNPSTLNPDFVTVNGIIPEEWKSINTITTPGLSLLEYDNHVKLILDPNALTIVCECNEPFQKRHKYPAHDIAVKYVKILPHTPYKNLGLNCIISIPRDEPQEWITKQFLKPALYDTRTQLVPKFIIKNKKNTLTLEFSYDQQYGKNSITVKCNIHYNGPHKSTSLYEKINEWPYEQKNIENEIIKLVQDGVER